MFELVMLLGFALAAFSQLLPTEPERDAVRESVGRDEPSDPAADGVRQDAPQRARCFKPTPIRGGSPRHRSRRQVQLRR